MIKTIIAVSIVFAAVLWFPLWSQIVLFIAAAVLIPYKLFLFVPAVVADVLYAPYASTMFRSMRTTLFVALLVIVLWFIRTQTRVGAIQKTYGI